MEEEEEKRREKWREKIFSRANNGMKRRKKRGGGGTRERKDGDGEEEGERARFTLQTTEERTRSGKLGGAPDTTLPSENLANKRRKQERGETPLSGGGEGLRKSKGR